MAGSIDVKILDRFYTVACSSNEEEKVRKLAMFMEKKARLAVENYGIIPERNLLFMIGMMITDEALKVHNKIANFESEISKLQSQIEALSKEQNQQSQDISVKSDETVYILEKVLNRVIQINTSIKDEINKLTNNIEENLTDTDSSL
jgi:cell division protein ZapA (FtsZ GTPase activity inhibitor)